MKRVQLQETPDTAAQGGDLKPDSFSGLLGPLPPGIWGKNGPFGGLVNLSSLSVVFLPTVATILLTHGNLTSDRVGQNKSERFVHQAKSDL